MIKIGLLGFGVVNSGVYEIFEERRKYIEEAIEDEFSIEKILVKNPKKHSDIKDLLVDNISEIIDDDSIDLVIEATGEVEAIEDDIKKILSKKNLISTNKALISKNFEEFNRIKKENKTKLRFDASVGGAIPVIENLYTISILDEVEEISGIFNGSCNFILSKMEEGYSFKDALEKAQDLGFAEADPKDDIEGFDSLRKLRIAASILFRKEIKEEDIDLEGITKIKKDHVKKASERGLRYKLIAYANKDGIYQVRPELLEKNSLFGSIKDNENIFQIKSSNSKDLILKGRGAGKRETGFSVLNDFLKIYSKN